MNTNGNTTTEELETLAKAVGLIVIQWGQAEQSLDLLVAVLWQSFDGSRFAKRIPIMLELKLKFVRASITSEPALASHTAATEQLMKAFERLGALRHDLIHGAVASISPIDNAFIFAKLDVREGFHHHREVRIEAKEYDPLIGELVLLGRRALQLATAIFDQAKRDRPHVK